MKIRFLMYVLILACLLFLGLSHAKVRFKETVHILQWETADTP